MPCAACVMGRLTMRRTLSLLPSALSQLRIRKQPYILCDILKLSGCGIRSFKFLPSALRLAVCQPFDARIMLMFRRPPGDQQQLALQHFMAPFGLELSTGECNLNGPSWGKFSLNAL